MNTTTTAATVATAGTYLLPARPALTVAGYLAQLTADKGCAHSFETGRVWMRLIRHHGSTRNAIGFVNVATGAVHRADSWKKPGRFVGFTLAV